MATLTQKERETVLLLFEEYTTFYNANSISKIIGKSITYKLNFSDNYVSQLVAFLLADEANKFKRWKEEFKELFKKDRFVMLFGSTVKDYAHAHDIDLMIVIENKEVKKVNAFLKKKEEILPKKLHAIKLNHQDLLENLKKRDKAFVDIIKNAIILYGQDKYVEILKNVTSL